MISLADVKAHLRVTHDEEDGLIQSCLNASVLRVSNDIQQVIVAEDATTKEGQIALNQVLRHAILLSVGDLYENRESVLSMGRQFSVNPTYDRLLAPYRAKMGV